MTMISSMWCSMTRRVIPAALILRMTLRKVMQLGRIDASGRLIEHQKLRVYRERASNLQEALLPVGEGLRLIVCALTHADEFQ